MNELYNYDTITVVNSYQISVSQQQVTVGREIHTVYVVKNEVKQFPLVQLSDEYSVLGCLSLSEQRADLGPGGLRSYVAELWWEPHGEPGQSAAKHHQALHAHRDGCRHPGTRERKLKPPSPCQTGSPSSALYM